MLRQLKKNIESDQFLKDSIDFFKGGGLPGRWTYSSPNFQGDAVNGAAQFSDFTKTSGYYLRRSEEQKIPQIVSEIIGLAGNFDMIVDMGCGDVFEQKIFPILEKINSDYAPIDINKKFLNTTTLKFKEKFPGRKIYPRHLNFMTENIEFSRAAFPIMLGCTITNFGTTESVRQILKQAKTISEKGSQTFFFTHDTNQDEVSLSNTYLHPLMQKHTLNILHRMKRDIPTQNFYPEQFGCDGHWDKNTSIFTIYIYPKRDMVFLVAGTEISLRKDEILPQAPLMKLSSEHVLHLANLEGFRRSNTIYDHDKKVAFQHVGL